MKLNVATYNIQHGIYYPLVLKSGNRDVALEPVISLLSDKKPDICGINEIYGKGVFGDQPKEIAEKLGYNYVFGKAIENHYGEYGNAIISRYPIKNAKVIAVKTEKGCIKELNGCQEDRALLIVEIDVNGKTITIMNCHFGLNAEEAEEAVNCILAEAKSIRTPIVLMGDFNITADNALYGALSDCFLDTAGIEEQLSFPSNKPNRKIDYIFVKGDIHVVKSWVEHAVISDHLPIFAILTID